MDDVRTALLEAQQNGEVLRVRYNGGSQPGTVRELIPVVVGDEQARCRCYTSGAVKSFALRKIEILERGSSAEPLKEWSAEAQTVMVGRPELTITDIHQRLAPDLATVGWRVGLGDDEFGASILLHAVTSKGVVRKNPKVQLVFQHTKADLVAQPDGSIAWMNHRPRVRPWSVRGPSGRSLGTWASCWPALAVFWEPAGIAPRDNL